MKIRSVTLEGYTRDGRDNVLEDPGLEDALRAVGTLDGTWQHGYAKIDLYDTEEYLYVGGGERGQFLVFFMDHGGANHAVVNPEKVGCEETVELFVCNQSDDWPAEQVLGRETMLRAVTHFLETGQRDPDLIWQEC